ncbi:MAG TPA: type III secretion system export apparatus subunit SctR [Myxococcaceae bacterium]|nr:type III secretion system export apparatus subunit SctR [Myxococcaceae bacterium]
MAVISTPSRIVGRACAWLFSLLLLVLPLIAEAASPRRNGGGAAAAGANGGVAQAPNFSPGLVNDAFSGESFTSRPVILIIALAALALVPFVLMMVTSFVKISVVLSVIRSALGTQQIPPTQVITGLAIILTVYIMAPVGIEMYRVGNLDNFRKGGNLFSAETVGQMVEAANRSKEPLRAFLSKKVTPKDRYLFYSLAKKMRKEEDRKDIGENDFMVVVPAFVVSELKEAFQIGFILFVPFLVIDMVVANILLALGMQMLSPTTISMPFKLLLFVLVDGWYLVAKGLVVGYL